MQGEVWQIGPLRVEPKQTLRGVFPVDIGAAQINFPIALVNGTRPDPVLLVTAGMDGDEYDGSQAALRLINALDPAKLNGRVMICPILDPVCFEALERQSPLDGLFLKHSFPGDLNGKPTQRLAHFIYQNFVLPADAWIDLQAVDVIGDSVPFVWTALVRDEDLNLRNRHLLHSTGARLGLLTTPQDMPLITHATSGNTALLRSQAGRRQHTDEASINYHLNVIHNVLIGLNMIPASGLRPPTTVYLDREVIRAGFTGLWYPQIDPGDTVEVGQRIGIIYQLDGGAVLQHIESPVSGVALAVQNGLATRSRLGMAVIAHRKQQR